MKVIDIKTREDITPLPPTFEEELALCILGFLKTNNNVDLLVQHILNKYHINKK